eukprot:g71765.t1
MSAGHRDGAFTAKAFAQGRPDACWIISCSLYASVELVELELLELASSSSSSDLTDRVVPLVPFLELSLDGRSDVAALAVPGVGGWVSFSSMSKSLIFPVS